MKTLRNTFKAAVLSIIIALSVLVGTQRSEAAYYPYLYDGYVYYYNLWYYYGYPYSQYYLGYAVPYFYYYTGCLYADYYNFYYEPLGYYSSNYLGGSPYWFSQYNAYCYIGDAYFHAY